MIRVLLPSASATASTAAASGRHRKVMSDWWISRFRSALSFRFSGSIFSRAMSLRPSKRSRIFSPVVPSCPSI